MDVGTIITQYAEPVVTGTCLCVGYCLKNVVPTEKINKYIPTVMGVLGVGFNVWIHGCITPEVILGGLVSGLASTGLHQAFTRALSQEDK